MSDKTLRVARTIEAFDYTDNRPAHLLNTMIEDDSIRNVQLVNDDITINGTAVPLGGSITIHNVNPPPVTPGNQSRLTINLNPQEFIFMDGQTGQVQMSVGISSGYTINNNVVSVQIRDQHNALIYSNSSVGNQSIPNFTVDRSIEGTVSVSVVAQVTRTSDGASYTDSRTAEIRVDYAWYSQRLSTAPTSLSDFSGNNGVFENNESFTAPSGTDTLYLALPHRTGGYAVLDGDLRIVTPGDGTSFDSGNYLLYSTTEAVAGSSYIITEV